MDKSRIILPAIYLVSSFIACTKKELKIIPLTQFNSQNTIKIDGRLLNDKAEVYLVQGYDDSKKTEYYIDQYVIKHQIPNKEKYDNYQIQFFKETKNTNVKSLQEDPKIMDRYSQEEDIIYWFRWSKGQFIGKFKFVDGVMVEPDQNDVKFVKPN